MYNPQQTLRDTSVRKSLNILTLLRTTCIPNEISSYILTLLLRTTMILVKELNFIEMSFIFKISTYSI